MIEGKCECGKVRYAVDAGIADLSHCHCEQCRRLHGAAFVSFAEVPRDKFRYLQGESELRVYASSEHNDRVFCGHCGSNILVDHKPDAQVLYLAMGCVDGNPDCPPAYREFVGSKAPWYEIGEDLPQHQCAAGD